MLTCCSRACTVACFALTLAAAPLSAQSRPGGWNGPAHGHVHHGSRGHWRFGLGLGWGWWGPYPYGAYPGYVVVEPSPMLVQVPPAPDAVSAAPRRPDPMFVPQKGQDPAQTEADRQACNRAAMTQPSAMADAEVFHQAALSCMERNGYSVR